VLSGFFDWYENHRTKSIFTLPYFSAARYKWSRELAQTVAKVSSDESVGTGYVTRSWTGGFPTDSFRSAKIRDMLYTNNINVDNAVSKDRDRYNLYLPIKKSDQNMVLGKVPTKVGSRPGGVVYPSLNAYAFANEFNKLTGCSKNIHNYAQVLGGFTETRAYFNGMAENRKCKTPSKRRLNRIVKFFTENIDLPTDLTPLTLLYAN